MTPFGQSQEFQVIVDGQEQDEPADSNSVGGIQTKVARLQRALQGATQAAKSLTPRFAAIRRALLDTPNAPEKLLDEAIALERRKNEILRALSGDQALRARNMNSASFDQRTRGRDRRRSAHVDGAADANSNRSIRRRGCPNSKARSIKLRQLIEVDLTKLEKQMEAAGAPWTPGRIPEWKDQ